jgi:hypothetical protein
MLCALLSVLMVATAQGGTVTSVIQAGTGSTNTARNSPFALGEALPKGMRISLESDKPVYFVGENILLHYRIDNVGNEPFKISVGGDYRGVRPTRFKITAVSSSGKAVEDPNPNPFSFGGLSPGGEIKPGGTWYEKAYITRYCRFETPGTYTVKVFHDLGFGEKRPGDPREVSITIKLRAPTEAQGRALLVAAEHGDPKNWGVWGQKGGAQLDYACLRHPAYLPALVERAHGTNFQNALEGIASIRTLKATQALADLLNDPVCGRAAAAKLVSRLPNAESDSCCFPGACPKPQFPASVWDKKLGPRVRDFALGLLANENRADSLLAASLLRCVGTPQEVPALLKALEYAVEHVHGEFSADFGYPPPLSACDKLTKAAMQIGSGSKALPRDIAMPGRALLFIAQREEAGRAGANGYEADYAKLLRHPIPYVRAKALAGLSTNIPPALAPLVTECLTDTDLTVRNFAFQIALAMQEPAHRDIALAELKSPGSDLWSRSAASTLALRYGARYECAAAWASHLSDTENSIGNHTFEVISHLYDVIAGPYHSGSGTRLEGQVAFQQRWESFLAANKKQIEGGHVFKRGEDLPADLLPPGFEFQAR